MPATLEGKIDLNLGPHQPYMQCMGHVFKATETVV